MIGQTGPSLSALLLDLQEAFAHPAAHHSGVEFPADLAALWAEALREAADQARTLEAKVGALTVQRDAVIERIGAMAYALDQMKARLPAQFPTPTARHTGNVIDLSEQFLREQRHRSPRLVDCQGDGA